MSDPSVGAPGTATEVPSVPWETVFVPNTPLNSPLSGATWAIQTSSTWPPVTTTLRFWADELPRASAVCTPPTQDFDESFRTQRWSWRRFGLLVVVADPADVRRAVLGGGGVVPAQGDAGLEGDGLPDRAAGGVGADRYDGGKGEPESWDEDGCDGPA